jgi:hypothetical protein
MGNTHTTTRRALMRGAAALLAAAPALPAMPGLAGDEIERATQGTGVMAAIVKFPSKPFALPVVQSLDMDFYKSTVREVMRLCRPDENANEIADFVLPTRRAPDIPAGSGLCHKTTFPEPSSERLAWRVDPRGGKDPFLIAMTEP